MKIFCYDRRLRDNLEVTQLIREVMEKGAHLPVEMRLSQCRSAICKWSKLFQENSKKKLETLRSQLDEAMSSGTPNEVLIQRLNSELLQTYKKEEEYWKQRSRHLWLTLGDANTGFFHVTTKVRKAKNRMTIIEDDNGSPWYEEDQISRVICDFYDKLFQSTNFDGVETVTEALQPCISQQQNEELIRDPTPKEIKDATFAIHPDKAQGPDGFSASFFQSNWETVGPAVVKEIQQFFSSGQISQNINTTYVRLIPKISGAKKVSDYRPIALCNVFYKIISKLLSIRLKPVLSSIISENQSAFIPGRAITENVLITHEVLHYLKISTAQKRCTMAVKTDMSKAYDRIEWNFLEQVLQRLGFHAKWTNWVMQCICTVTYSYLINDFVQGSVKPLR